jgi:hypothetical protein
MNWYKIALRNRRQLNDSELQGIRWDILELYRKLPEGTKIITEDNGGFSVADEENNIIVFNEATIELAIRHALARFKYIINVVRAFQLLNIKLS